MRIALAVALLVACGDDGQTTGDGGPDDGGGDDTMIDADPNVRGTVTVRIVDKNDAALAGMYVVFIDTDATITERMTDAAGIAVADVYPNASVSAVRSRGMSYAIATVQALNPGDTITLISAASDVSSSEDPFSQRVVPMPGADIAPSPIGATKSAGISTFTTLAPHGLAAGDRVIIARVGVPDYNGTWTVASVPSPTTFTVEMNGGGVPSSGTVAIGATATKAFSFTLNYTAYTGADHYDVLSRCGSFYVGLGTSPTLWLPVACSGAAMNFEVHAKSSAGTTLAWMQQQNVTVTANGMVTFTDTWHTPSSLTATYANSPAEVSDITVARFSPYVRGLPFAEASSPASAPTLVTLPVGLTAKAAMSTTFTCPNGASATCLATPSGAASQRITENVDGTQSSYSLDAAANLLPWVKALYVPATTTLDITMVGSGAFDIFEANLRYTRGQYIYTWRVFGPLASSVKFPPLPASAPGNPTLLTSDIASSYQAFVGESDAVNGYRDAIKNPFAALGACEASSNMLVKSSAGTKNRISQWN